MKMRTYGALSPIGGDTTSDATATGTAKDVEKVKTNKVSAFDHISAGAAEMFFDWKTSLVTVGIGIGILFVGMAIANATGVAKKLPF